MNFDPLLLRTTLVIICALATMTASPAVVVVSFSGDMLPGASQNLANGNVTALSLSTAITPAPVNYTGQAFYGGRQLTQDATAGSWNLLDNSGATQLQSIATPNTSTPADTITNFMVFYKQEDFLTLSTVPGGVILDSTTSLSATMARFSNSASLRFVIQTSEAGNPFYASGSQAIAGGVNTLNLNNPSAASWVSFTPLSTLTSAAIGSSATPDLTKVIGIGIWTQNVSTGTNVNHRLDIRALEFNAIPEPSTWVLLAGSLAALFVFRRRLGRS